MPKTRTVSLFLAGELSLYTWFLWLDLFRGGAGGNPVKFASIALCLLFTAGWALRGGDRLTAAAMCFTLGADVFLLLLNRGYGAGVLLFCVVQGLYLCRLCRANGNRTLWGLRAALFLLSLGALAALGLLTSLNALVLFYFTNFVCNVLLSFHLSGPRGRLFSWGLVLFLCCDVCVGGFNAPDLLPQALAEPVRVGMWLFYLPGQVLLALSSLPEGLFLNSNFKR